MVLDKFTKTQIALDNGLDIILELPYLGAVASADYFCYNAIQTLLKLQITDLVFGVELYDLSMLKKMAHLTNSLEFNEMIKTFLNQGYSYSTASNKTIELITGDLTMATAYSQPNNILGIQYLRALEMLESNVEVTLIQRIENHYYDETVTSNIASATAIRGLLAKNENITNYVIDGGANYIDLNEAYTNLFLLLKSTILLTDDLSYFTTILGVKEGIENRLFSSLLKSCDYKEFVATSATKRYTTNHIQRLLLHILLDIKVTTEQRVDYLRILGFNKKGENYIASLPSTIKKQIITSFKNKESNHYVSTELKATKLYGILCDKPNLFLKEYTIPIRSE